MQVSDNLTWIRHHLAAIYDRNPYVTLLQIRIEELEQGRARLAMPVNITTHTNLYGVAHGGALASLEDTAMGVACATLKNRVVTIEMNINYIRGAQPQEAIYAEGKVIHCGKNTMVVEADICDFTGQLVA